MRLARSIALAALLASGSYISPALAQRAVAFNGNTYLFSNSVATPTPQPYASEAGVVSYWYASSFPTTAAIATITPNPQSNQPAFQVMHQKLVGDDGQVRFEIYMSPSGQSGNVGFTSSFMLLVGTQALPYDGKWHHVSATWDSIVGEATYSIDGRQGTWDQRFTKISSQWWFAPFKVQYSNPVRSPLARYYVGGAPGPVSVPNNVIPLFAPDIPVTVGPSWAHFVGSLAEFYLHAAASDYTAILTPNRSPMFGNFALLTDLGIAPLELGVSCSSIFGANSLPILCMRGGALFFAANSGLGTSSFTVIGTLTNAVSDPFEDWP